MNIEPGGVRVIQRRIHSIVLPNPESIPNHPRLAMPGLEGPTHRLIIGMGALATADGPAARGRCKAALGECLAAVDAAVAPSFVPDDAAKPGVQAHDHYFRLARLPAADPEAATAGYGRGLLHALCIWLSETEDEPLSTDGLVLAFALVRLWAVQVLPAATQVCPLPAGGIESATGHWPEARSVQRWIRGHQIFAALTQGLIWTLNRFELAVATKDHRLAHRQLRAVAELYDASAAAFRFTSEFPSEHYRDVIRPSMEPPHAPAGFSGALSADHGVLIRRLSALRPALEHAGRCYPADNAVLTQALAHLYADHKRVCARLAGADSASLRTEQMAGRPSAIEMLDRFRDRRLAMVRLDDPQPIVVPAAVHLIKPTSHPNRPNEASS